MSKNQKISNTGFRGVYKSYGSKTYYYSTFVNKDPYRKGRIRVGGFKTAFEAAEALKVYERNTKREISYIDRVQRVGYLINEYLIYKKGKVKASTYHQIVLLLDKYIEKKKYNELTFEEFSNNSFLDRFMSNLRNMNISIPWKNKILFVLNDMFEYGALSEILPGKIANKVKFKTPKFKRTVQDNLNSNKNNYWTKEQWKTFMSVVDKESKWYMFFALYGQLGCRLGEIRGLQNKHVINNATEIRIEQQAQNKLGLGKTIITTPKTASSYRTVSISSKTCCLLKEYMKIMESEDPNRFLFFNNDRTCAISCIRREFDKYIKIAKLPRITLHGIRHSNCTWLLSKNLSPQEIGQVSRRLGHSSVKITLDIYMGIHKEENIEIKKALDEI